MPNPPEIHTGYIPTRFASSVALSIVMAMLAGACSPNPEQPIPPGVNRIQLLPPAKTEDIYSHEGTRASQRNMAKLLQELGIYCAETGCDAKEMIKRTSFSDTADPAKKYIMVTRISDDGRPITIIYNSPISECDTWHEAVHLEVTSKDAPEETGRLLGIPGKIRFDGFALTALSLTENKSSLTHVEEGTADAIALGLGGLEGVKCKTGYGDSGFFVLAIAEKSGVSFKDLIQLHKTSDLIGFLSRLTGSNDNLTNFIFFTKIHDLIDKMLKKNLSLIDALKEYDKVASAFRKKSSLDGNEFTLYFNEHASIPIMMNSTEEYMQSLTQPAPAGFTSPIHVVEKRNDGVAGTIRFPYSNGRWNLSMKPLNQRGNRADYSPRHKKAHQRGKQS
ncbi:hypothetical protein HZC27_05980 [Candidatus Roizmanbacteria bacterium]|nr:hypothetical protein [Candidatus Roizmanbacteria bacterium]